MVRQGVRAIIESHPNLQVVGEARDGEEAVELAHSLHPDLVLMDIRMPRMNGIEATRKIKKMSPEIEIVGLSVYENEQVAAAMKRAGARECLSKGDSPKVLIDFLESLV